VDFADRRPVVGVGDVQPGPDDVLARAAGGLDGRDDGIERPPRPGGGLARCDRVAILVGRRGPGDDDAVVDADGPRVADPRFSLGAGRDALSVHTEPPGRRRQKSAAPPTARRDLQALTSPPAKPVS